MRFLSPRRLQNLLAAVAMPMLVHCGDPVQPGSTSGGSTFDYRDLPRCIASLELNLPSYQASPAAMHGNWMVVANSNLLKIFNVENPTAPRQTAEVETATTIVDVDVQDGRIFVVDEEGLTILDVEKPQSKPLGSIELDAGETPKLVRVGTACFVASSKGIEHYLYLIDVTNPGKPQIQTKVSLGAEVTDLAEEQNLVLVGTQHGSVFLDISNVDQVETLSTIGVGRSVALGNGFAYVSGVEFGGGQSGLTVLDVQDPRNPVGIGSTHTPRGIGPIVLQGGLLFVRVRDHIDIINVTDRRNLRFSGSIAADGVGAIHVRGDHVWSTGTSLEVHDVSGSLDVPILGERGIQTSGQFAQLQDGRLYGRSPQGLFVMDVKDPTLPTPKYVFPGPGSRPVTFSTDMAYLYPWQYPNTGAPQIRVRHLHSGNDWATIDFAGLTVRNDDYIHVVKVVEDVLYAVVLDHVGIRYQLFLFDIANARRPILLGSVLGDGDPRVSYVEFEVAEGLALISYYDGNHSVLDIVDVSNPTRPVQVSQLEGLHNYLELMKLNDGYLYAIDDDGDLVTVNLRKPEHPIVTSLLEDVYANDLAVARHTFYALNGSGLQILDISNPSRPQWIATRGQLSSNTAYRVLAGTESLYLITENGLQAMPLHARRR